jgi:SAM-dependent methyltransferase
MDYSVYDMKNFYQARAGRLVRRLLADPVRAFWPEAKGLNMLGYGYALPLLNLYEGEAGRVTALMPDNIGIHHWPISGPGRAVLAHESEWPYETESVDRIVMLHAVEHADHPEEVMREAWRVLKSNGRLLMVVPHRMGLWARADWTPFGHGRPFTSGQIRNLLQAGMFVREGSARALFMPPFKSFMVLASAYQFEAFGRLLFPGLCGVYIVEASKQIYGGTLVGKARVARPRLNTLSPLGRGVG